MMAALTWLVWCLVAIIWLWAVGFLGTVVFAGCMAVRESRRLKVREGFHSLRDRGW